MYFTIQYLFIPCRASQFINVIWNILLADGFYNSVEYEPLLDDTSGKKRLRLLPLLNGKHAIFTAGTRGNCRS